MPNEHNQANIEYKDYSNADINDIKREINVPQGKRKGPRGGVVVPFPVKLYKMLEGTQREGLEHVVSWQSHGRCFLVHEPDEFVADILPRYFRQSKLTSFQRQLNLYGFQRMMNGVDRGGYYHELFLNGRSDICQIILRTRVKGSCMTAPTYEHEPDLYSFPFCSTSRVKSTAVVESSDEDKHLHDDASAHSCCSASTLGPQYGVRPSATPDEIQSIESCVIPEILSDEDVDMDLLVTPESSQEQAEQRDSFASPETHSTFSSSMTAAVPFIIDEDYDLRVMPQEDKADLVDFSLVSVCDGVAFFEGCSFQCIDEATLRSMEAVLINNFL